MPFRIVLNTLDVSTSDIASLNREFDFLRTELDDTRTKNTALLADITDIRTKFGSLLTKLDADVGVTDVNYVSTQALAAATVTALAARQFTAT